VTTDLYQSSVAYGWPAEAVIPDLTAELETLLAGGYVEKYQFGFKRGGEVVWGLRYRPGPDGSLVSDSRAGGIPRGVDVSGAAYFNLLWPSPSWNGLTVTARENVEKLLPFLRAEGPVPGEALGSWVVDRGYTAGGVLVTREVFRRNAA